ncbi:beta-trefoil [Lichtheimia hyalospora FSU 10163]|nr:beta-trefoil [Lichtheimia hyalospora FSU 10163]
MSLASSPSSQQHPQQPQPSLSFSDSNAVLNFLQSEGDPFPQPSPKDMQRWIPTADERSMLQSENNLFHQQESSVSNHEGSFATVSSSSSNNDSVKNQIVIDNMKKWFRSHLQNYLLAPNPVAMGERTIVILTGKVAQKSYGTEKRFLCPPPTVILSGDTWWSPSSSNNEQGDKLLPPILKVVMSTETSEIQEGQVDWYSTSGALVGQTGFPPPPLPPSSPALHVAQQPSSSLSGRISHGGRIRASFDRNSTITTTDRDWYRVPKDDPLVGGKCVLKQLYVNDVEEGKGKQVECLARIHLADGTIVGTLASRSIKVISKPSKKRHNSANLDACIRHGSLVSLFNRIRSQTVSTKYLGVSSSPCPNASSATLPFIYPGQCHGDQPLPSKDKCFSARTGSWEPFVIWLVDMHWKPPQQPSGNNNRGQQASGRQDDAADEYIGANCASTLRGGVPYPSPPAIAFKNRTHQPLTIHYNQHVVLQCLTTGLVSPVMIIRKVDRASNVAMGGANITHCYPQASKNMYGGEYGDEIIGEPVSQLNKVAFQMVTEDASASMNRHQNLQNDSLPQSYGPATYLACFHDTVGMHRTSNTRKPMAHASQHQADTRHPIRRRIASVGGNSGYIGVPHVPIPEYHHQQDMRAGPPSFQKRSRSISGGERNIQFSSSSGVMDPTSWTELGAYWSEKVPDSTIWTIVGTECAKYTIWQPSPQASDNAQHMIPRVFSYSHSLSKEINDFDPQQERDSEPSYLSLYGEHFSDQLDVWFGDIRSTRCEHVGRGQIVCKVPPKNTLANAVGVVWKTERLCTIPLLLATKDGNAVYKTNKYYVFSP